MAGPPSKTPPWADLHSELLSLIFSRLQFLDLLHSKSVCRSWRHVEPHGSSPQQIPWLILSLHRKYNSQRFYSLFHRKIHRFTFTIGKTASGSICSGSFDNWLVLSNWVHGIFLLNPFKNAVINIPSPKSVPLLSGYYSYTDPFFARKVILSNSPNGLENCFMAAIFYPWRLAVCKPNGKYWFARNYLPDLVDIIFRQGKLYGIDFNERVFVFNIGEKNDFVFVRGFEMMKIERRLGDLDECKYTKRVYIVESCVNGELLMVLRYLKRLNEYGLTVFFKVYELDCISNSNSGGWKERENFNGEAIFVGRSGSRSILVENLGFEGNCIYFLDDGLDLRQTNGIHSCDDMGVFYMKNASIEKLVKSQHDSSLSPPAWFYLSNDLSDY